jgi:hypothetical protein
VTTERQNQAYLGLFRRLIAGVSILALVVVVLGGMLAGARVITVAYRSFLVMTVTKIVGVLLIKVLINYEEIGRDKD